MPDTCYKQVARGQEMSHGARSKRIAVTGATGFVGRHVVQHLLASGHEVVSISRRSGTDLASPDPAAIKRELEGCDAVVHCAGINREIGSQTYDAVHVRGTQVLVEA